MAVGLTLNMLTNKVLVLLREETYNQDPTQPAIIPIPADFSQAMITNDLNYAQQKFMGDTGLTGRLIEKMVTLPIAAGLDYVLPTDLQSLTRVEYSSVNFGMTGPQKLRPRSFDEFDALTAGGADLSDTGYPTDYRSPFGSGANVSIRLYPQPVQGNAGIASQILQVGGTPVAGNTIGVVLNLGTTHIYVGPYTVGAFDNIYTIAAQLTTLINASLAVVGAGAFCGTALLSGASITIPALSSGPQGNAISVTPFVTGTGVNLTPSTLTSFVGGGLPDSIILYYTSLGTSMVAGTDEPGLPPQFHIALAYFVLKDYWRRKDDPEAQADRYERNYKEAVARAMAYPLDSDRATVPAFIDEESVDGGDLFFSR